ncbi:type IV pilus assembly protein PilM [Mariprofundus ferrinatatus]|uniref:Type IV pilus assembly protein PilM n=2 Tax=Mariprofundus ferrinatatus TaxID=1921087 RepID=A0A2K8L5J6_9PROT|nr:type IV pilus assembly protein PilM [Mariprofundus ferrinatatus]
MGVDISSTGIKLIELTRSGSGYELSSLATVPLPRDAIVENTIIDSTAVAEALREAVNIAKPSTKSVALAVSGNAVIIKTISIPEVSEFELEAQIQIEADEHIPYDIDDVFLDFYIQGMTPDNPELIDVVLVACKREIIEDYQMVMSEAGLTAKCVDCAVFALENGAEAAGVEPASPSDAQAVAEEDADVYALVNIGANMMNINVLINGKTAFVRDQFYGGKQLTEEIQKEHGVSYQAAEQLKIEDFESIHPDALEHFYLGLTSELVRSLDFYSASKAEFPVRRILLSGGCALIPDIATELEQRLGIDTAILNPFDHIKIPSKKFDKKHLQRIGPMLMVPVGLATRSFDE